MIQLNHLGDRCGIDDPPLLAAILQRDPEEEKCGKGVGCGLQEELY